MRLLQFAAGKASLRAGGRAVIGHAVQHIFLLAVRRHRRIQVPAARILLAQMIQTEVGHDAVDPGVERTLEAETRQIDVRPQKRFLINVLPIFRRTGEVNGQTQHGAIVLPHQFFERGGVALLGLANQRGIVHPDRRAPAARLDGGRAPGGSGMASHEFCRSQTYSYSVYPTNL